MSRTMSRTMKVVNITTSSSPVSTGHIADGGWNWSYPAIAKVAGTTGNLERWVTGYLDVWQNSKDPSKEERSFRWEVSGSKETAWEWFESRQ